jgi:PAS domain S-box-containing protein
MDYQKSNKEEQFRILFEHASDGIFVADIPGNFIDVNEAGCRLFGYTKEEMMRVTFAEILVQEEIERIEGTVQRLNQGEVVRGNRKFKRKDGRIFIGEVASIRLPDGSFQSIIRDVTEQIKVKDAIVESEERLRHTLDQLLEGCMIVGFDWTYHYLNDSINKGSYTREELLGRSMLDMYPGVEKTNLFAHYKICMEDRIPQRFEESFTYEDGRTVWHNLSVEPVPEGIFVLALDITERKKMEEQLRNNEARLKAALALTKFTLFNQDLDLRYTWIFQSQIGLTPEQVIGKTDVEIMTSNPEAAQKLTEIKRGVLQNGESAQVQIEYNHNNKILQYSIFAEPQFSADGQIIGITGASLDITERKKAEETIRSSETKWRNLFEILPVGVSVVDSTRKIVEFNNALCQILDLTQEELMNGKNNYRRYLNSDYTAFNFQEYPSSRSILENKIIKDVEIGAEKEDGTMKWLSVSAAPIPHLNSSIVSIIDITQRKKWEEEIQNSKMQLDLLNKHINEVREEERSVIAREIHDELGQTLASLKLDLIGINEELDEQLQLKQRINKTIEMVDSSIKTVRKISSALRPQILDELGLASAMEWLANDFKKRSGLKCKLELQEVEELDSNISIALFRIFQAAMTNIVLHSGAKSVAVKLGMNNELLILSVKDDGIGISQEYIHSPKSFGIVGMKERTKQINGTFEIHSEINIGTEIRITVPVTGKTKAL